MSYRQHKIAVIMPCYRVSRQVLAVLARIGPEVDMIFVVDDACPENSGELVRTSTADPRVQVLLNNRNLGVGGATMTGYREALAQGADILVKVDGDGQMNPTLIPEFLETLFTREADYVKGNRFYRLAHARSMPRIRLIGNLILSFMTKISSGYWDLMDPTNGFTALRADVACELPFDRIDHRFFFESDMLFHLYLADAVVHDVSMLAVYADEQSNLKISHIFLEFFAKNLRNTCRRIATAYFLKDFNLGSAELVIGAASLLFGLVFGSYSWAQGIATHTAQSSGTVMLAALPTLLGLQLLIAFVTFDVNKAPRQRLARPEAALLRTQFTTRDDKNDSAH